MREVGSFEDRRYHVLPIGDLVADDVAVRVQDPRFPAVDADRRPWFAGFDSPGGGPVQLYQVDLMICEPFREIIEVDVLIERDGVENPSVYHTCLL